MILLLSILTNIIVIFPREGGVRGEWGTLTLQNINDIPEHARIVLLIYFSIPPQPSLPKEGREFRFLLWHSPHYTHTTQKNEQAHLWRFLNSIR